MPSLTPHMKGPSLGFGLNITFCFITALIMLSSSFPPPDSLRAPRVIHLFAWSQAHNPESRPFALMNHVYVFHDHVSAPMVLTVPILQLQFKCKSFPGMQGRNYVCRHALKLCFSNANVHSHHQGFLLWKSKVGIFTCSHGMLMHFEWQVWRHTGIWKI